MKDFSISLKDKQQNIRVKQKIVKSMNRQTFSWIYDRQTDGRTNAWTQR